MPVRPVVDQCCCAGVTFAQLLTLIETRSLNYEQLQDATGCGTQCAMCEPYVRLVIQTRKTAFVPLTASQIDAIMCKPRP